MASNRFAGAGDSLSAGAGLSAAGVGLGAASAAVVATCITADERFCMYLLCLQRVGAWPCEDTALKWSQWAQQNMFMHSVIEFLSSIGHYH